MTKCRCCGLELKKGLGFQSHIMKHKRDFCKIIGRAETDAWKINWEDVVLHFNPEEADEKKCLHYNKIGTFSNQKSLVQFEGWGK